MKILAKSGILFLIFITIGVVFYKEELRFLMPTPVPENLISFPIGSVLPHEVAIHFPNNKRIKLLHFFNPNCPCSKFNKKHVAEMIHNYGDKVEFYSILEKEEDLSQNSVLEGETKALVDEDKEIAKQLGVYATPQAVILSEDNVLLYRGNFNKARYCTTPQTQYAKAALDSILNGNRNPIFTPSASQAYGCSIY